MAKKLIRKKYYLYLGNFKLWFYTDKKRNEWKIKNVYAILKAGGCHEKED